MRDDWRSIDEFLSRVHKQPSVWRALDVRAVVLSDGDHAVNLVARCYLDPRNPKEVTRLQTLPATRGLAVLQHVLPVSELRPLLESVMAGELTLGNQRIRFRGREGSDGPGYRDITYGYEFLPDIITTDSEVPWGRTKYLFASYENLTLYSGVAVHTVMDDMGANPRRIDDELRALECPIDGLRGVGRFLLGDPDGAALHVFSRLDVIAPYPVTFATEACTFDGGVAQLAVRSALVDPSEAIRVGVFAWNESGSPESRVFPWKLGRTASSGGLWRQRFEVGRFSAAQFFLQVGERAVDALHLRGEGVSNLRRLVYEGVDPSSKNLAMVLSNRTDSTGFERGVRRLFHLLGFAVDGFAGEGRLTDAPDVLAFDEPGNLLLVIECTTGSIDSEGKLGKLIKRRALFESLAPEFDVRGVMISVLTENELSSAEVERCARDRLILISYDELQELIDITGASNPRTRARLLLKEWSRSTA